MPFRIKSATYLKSVVDLKGLPRDRLPEVAFAGRSNVGKSSALNRLVNLKKLAKISSTPGKTRMINFFLINKNLYFVDLPGYGYARAPKSMQKSWGKPMEPDLQLLEWLDYYGLSKLIVLTKKDKLSRSAVLENARKTCEVLKLDSGSLVLFSAKTGEGKDKILNWIQHVISE
jgi:GTP-binding protein